jgi:predicted XRE-type DNA-binding protein
LSEDVKVEEKAAMRLAAETAITKSSGNVYADLGFSPSEARNLQMRSQMMTALRKFIEEEGLTQADAAKRLKVGQPRISNLTRGRISRFSLDALVNLLSHAGLAAGDPVHQELEASGDQGPPCG